MRIHMQQFLGEGAKMPLAMRILATSLHRYEYHRRIAYNREMKKAFAVFCASLRIKWDETEQIIHYLLGCLESEANDGEQECSKVLLRKHVMALIFWVKTTDMPVPMPWLVSALLLERTTAEALYTGIKMRAPWGPWSLPTTEEAFWLWLILHGDLASSNLRLYNQIEMQVMGQRVYRPRVLLTFVPCLMHIMHRSKQSTLTGESLWGERLSFAV